MDNNIKSNTSFWSEISDYKIQVPYYQRDYAQGRIDNGRIDNIRKVFVEEMYGAIKGSNNECHLGLVFGSYDENEKVFIAVDGQQRLTTVFLLHWYVAWRENKLNDYKEKLLNFSWDTRSYSSQFVELLFKIPPSNNVIDAIKTNSYYFSVWENDPTVKGMLTMIEEIEKQYPNDMVLCSKLFSNNCKIKYDILKLEKDSDGKTYLKMNSRGRSLTTFELFKSKFLDKYHPDFGHKFDKEWLNFILKNFAISNSPSSDPDIPFMNFINEYTYLQLKLTSGSDIANDYKKFTDAKVKGELTDVPFINFDNYNRAFEGRTVLFEKSLDWICQNYEKIKLIDNEIRFSDSRFFIDAVIKDNNPYFTHRAKLFAVFKYAELTGYAQIDTELYKKWTRVFRNLVANTDIDASNIGGICKAINEIDNSDIYGYLSNGREISAFTKDQVAEEIAKAKQILYGAPRSDGKSWEEIIVKAENYAFFKGAIRFLFTDGEANGFEFDTKWGNAQKYFDGNGVKDDKKVFLTKSLVIQCDNWDEQLYDKQIFNPNANTWKWILTSKNWRGPVHHILTGDIINPTTENNNKNVKEFVTPILKDLPFDFIINNEPDGRFRWLGPRLCFYKPYGRDMATFDWENWHRNKILSSLLRSKSFTTKAQMGESDFFWGWNINFNYEYKGNIYYFQWLGRPNEKERDVYLMEKKDWKDHKKRQDPPIEGQPDSKNYYCFEVTKDMETDASLFTTQLESLIAEAFLEKSNKPMANAEGIIELEMGH